MVWSEQLTRVPFSTKQEKVTLRQTTYTCVLEDEVKQVIDTGCGDLQGTELTPSMVKFVFCDNINQHLNLICTTLS